MILNIASLLIFIKLSHKYRHITNQWLVKPSVVFNGQEFD